MKTIITTLITIFLSSSFCAQNDCDIIPTKVHDIHQGSRSVAIVWNELPNDVGEYQVQYRTRTPGNSPSGHIWSEWQSSQFSSNSNFILLTMLKEEQGYEYVLKKRCSDNTLISASGLRYIETGDGIPACTPQSASNSMCIPKSTEAQIFWHYVKDIPIGNFGNNRDAYHIRYRVKDNGHGNWKVLKSAFANKRLINLTPNTEYEYGISALCPDGSRTPFSVTSTFTTLP